MGRTINVKIPETVNMCLSLSHQLLNSLEVGKAKGGVGGLVLFLDSLITHAVTRF